MAREGGGGVGGRRVADDNIWKTLFRVQLPGLTEYTLRIARNVHIFRVFGVRSTNVHNKSDADPAGDDF